MRSYCFYLLFFATLSVSAQNLQLAGQLSYGNSVLANIGGYVDSLNNEYALVGTDFGLSIVDVTVPSNPVIRYTVPGPTSDWREVKTYKGFAYVATEGGGGLTVVDLRSLPSPVVYHQYTGDGAISGQLSSIHALHVDTSKGFLYLYGSNIGSGNTLFFDLSSPSNPSYVGQYVYPAGGNSAYVHDGYADNDTLYESHIYSGFFAIIDVSNKSNPVLLGTQSTPTSFTHNTWLSNDHKTLFTTDENSGSYVGAFDVSDPTNIQELSRFQTSVGSGAIVHNTHILNDFAITSWYKEGVVITDVSRPWNQIEVGHYDTYPQGSGNGFNGCWGVYPFLPSGTIVASDIDNGLFVLTPDYVRGCYLEGTVTDSISGFILPGVTVQLVQAVITKITNSTGQYATGTATAGTYDVIFSRIGYVSQTFTGVVLANGQLTQLDVRLKPVSSIPVQGQIVDANTTLPVSNSFVSMQNPNYNLDATSTSAGTFSFPSVVEDSYQLTAGQWGYYTQCSTVIANDGPFVLQLTPGYQDDFSFDYGWTISSTTTNPWERAEPLGTFDNNNAPINPDYDASGDCGELCFVTDNGAGAYNSHDVDNGYSLLTSPVFDLSGYQNPVIDFDRWFVNTGGSGTPNDSMIVSLTDGVDTVRLTAINRNSPGLATWYHESFVVSYFITPGTTMRLLVGIEDYAPGHIVEGGFDNFMVTGSIPLSASTLTDETSGLLVYPNPSNGQISVRFPVTFKGSCQIQVVDVVGRSVFSTSIDVSSDQRVEETFPPGSYVVTVSDSSGHRYHAPFIVR